MKLTEKEIICTATNRHTRMLENLTTQAELVSGTGNIPVRLAVTETNDAEYRCELGVLSGMDTKIPKVRKMFDFRRREYENQNAFNVVFLVPTGIGARLGGHSGDACPAARLMGSVCDTLITHPNVVNASDINELPDNGLYVEGSLISRLLMGTIGLRKVRSNRVLLVVDAHQDAFFVNAAVNTLSAARAAFGIESPGVIVLDPPMSMHTNYAPSGRASGSVEALENLCSVLETERHRYDAVALSSVIQVPDSMHLEYFEQEDMVNPWGGVEAMLTHAVSLLYDIPSAHAPMMNSQEVMDLDVGIVDPRKAAEAISTSFLYCALKGLHRSPRVVDQPPLHGRPDLITAADISCLVIPDKCVGIPTLAALEQQVPVIAVRGNDNCMNNRLEDLPFEQDRLIFADNYLEAAGIVAALRSGVALDSIRRPMPFTPVTTQVASKRSVFAEQPAKNAPSSHI